ncbi:dihydrolipoyl dehydrogenase [mine drainage metagenome]|uniref:Dihydrolipoyl dehydrogenase n=1 Tax=mine drainage metagenome TaxID=410659 RepID=A0A1J5Q974_9ZZZZ
MTVPAQVDCLILGAGYPAALFLAQAGKSALMVDPIGNLGGDCLAEGCVPSKAVREAALVRGLADKFAHFGLRGAAQAEAAFGASAVAVTHDDYATDSRAQIYGETLGFIKLVFDLRNGLLLGAQIAGMDAAQLIAPLALALEQGLGAAALADTAFPHPMLSEGINKAARAFFSSLSP